MINLLFLRLMDESLKSNQQTNYTTSTITKKFVNLVKIVKSLREIQHNKNLWLNKI